MYDFASSGYTTVVITAVFNAYFVALVGGVPWATLAWTATLSLSYALIVLTAPLHGAIADVCAWKKRGCWWRRRSPASARPPCSGSPVPAPRV